MDFFTLFDKCTLGGILSGGSSGMRAKAWFWFLVMLVIPTSTGVRRWSKIGLGRNSGAADEEDV